MLHIKQIKLEMNLNGKTIYWFIFMLIRKGILPEPLYIMTRTSGTKTISKIHVKQEIWVSKSWEGKKISSGKCLQISSNID